MKLRLTSSYFFLLAAVLGAASGARADGLSGAAPAKLRPGIDFVEGEMLVKFRPAAHPSDRSAVLARRGATRIATLASHDGELHHLRLAPGENVAAAVAALGDEVDVEFAQPNYIYRMATVPNDTQYGQQWGLKNTGQTVVASNGPRAPLATANPGTSGKDMGLEAAWSQITDCSAVTVAVIDSGVNYNHADLSANMWNGGATYPNHGYDFVTNTNDPMDRNGHGTHVAGVIGAVGNNGVGIAGICWNARIMAVRALDAAGSGNTATIIQAVNFAVANGARVLNMSVNGTTYDAAFDSALTNAQNSGAVIVVAAGNDGLNTDGSGNAAYPCNYTQSNLICVAALDQSFGLASFSNYGASSVDVGAPGVNILSTWAGAAGTIADPLTSGWSGTSTTSTGWGYKTLNFGSTTACLVDPPTYDHSTARYANSTDDRFWKSFNTAGTSAAVLNFYVMYDVETTNDGLKFYVNSTSGDPVPASHLLESVSGSSGGGRVSRSYDISAYIGTATTVGFELTSNASISNFGANVSVFSISTLTNNATTYNVDAGTSMATPHVAGLAAMVMAYNPSYTGADVVASVKGGGLATASLSGKTTTGKSVNAMGSLSFIGTPGGVTATKL